MERGIDNQSGYKLIQLIEIKSFTSLSQYLFLLANAFMFANCRYNNSGDYNKRSLQNNAEVLRLT